MFARQMFATVHMQRTRREAVPSMEKLCGPRGRQANFPSKSGTGTEDAVPAFYMHRGTEGRDKEDCN